QAGCAICHKHPPLLPAGLRHRQAPVPRRPVRRRRDSAGQPLHVGGHVPLHRTQLPVAAVFCLLTLSETIGQHRTIWQEHSAKDFASYESYKRAGILYVFPPFITARMRQKIGRRPQTQLCGAAIGDFMAILQVTAFSKCLMRNVPLTVVLPVDRMAASPRTEYPTLYLLLGIFGNTLDFLNGTRIGRWAMERELCVVMPSGENSFYLNDPDQFALWS